MSWNGKLRFYRNAGQDTARLRNQGSAQTPKEPAHRLGIGVAADTRRSDGVCAGFLEACGRPERHRTIPDYRGLILALAGLADSRGGAPILCAPTEPVWKRRTGTSGIRNQARAQVSQLQALGPRRFIVRAVLLVCGRPPHPVHFRTSISLMKLRAHEGNS